jgi:hypothetical protein
MAAAAEEKDRSLGWLSRHSVCYITNCGRTRQDE